jgi:hypothetical protein
VDEPDKGRVHARRPSVSALEGGGRVDPSRFSDERRGSRAPHPLSSFRRRLVVDSERVCVGT